MSTTSSSFTAPAEMLVPIAPRVPPLEAGSQLTAREFEERYAASPWIKRAELIEGIVYMHAANANLHSDGQFKLVGWLSTYAFSTPGTSGGGEATIRLDGTNVPQPDAHLKIESARGGHAKVSADGVIEGPPELVGEISLSSASYDLGSKLLVYRRSGVPEYIVWQRFDEVLDWFVQRDDQFVPLEPDADGVLRSLVFPGLWLDRTALLRDDMPTVMKVLQQGLATPEHAEFVAKLAAAKTNQDQ